MKSVLITGANGQIGQELQTISRQFPDFHCIFTDRRLLDITDRSQIQDFFIKNAIDYCLNCAAYTAVDKAESEPELARAVNAKGVANLAEACQKTGAALIHFSTDYVYHSSQNIPFREDDPTHPQSVYAQTKLAGELAAREACKQTMIIRTSWVYSSFGHNFVKTMLRLARERPSLRVVFDQVGTPTYARDLAEAVMHILQATEQGAVEQTALRGIYHYSHEGVTSWYDFAQAIFEIAQVNCAVYPIETKDYPTPAVRPPYSVLNKAKFKGTFGMEIPHWRDGLKRCLALMKSHQ